MAAIKDGKLFLLPRFCFQFYVQINSDFVIYKRLIQIFNIIAANVGLTSVLDNVKGLMFKKIIDFKNFYFLLAVIPKKKW